LLAALAAGLPVIATPQCGIGHLPGVTEVPAGDAAALTEALSAILGTSETMLRLTQPPFPRAAMR
jgi:glycosyltransferase involved in cell wall biosynthesis